jgi:hypothetical protein
MRIYSVLNLDDVQIGLEDLLTNQTRHTALLSTKSGAAQEDILKSLQQDINALPDAPEGGAPLAEELAETDGEYDGFGGGIWYLTEAYLRIPGLDPKLADAVRRIRAAFIPAMGELNESYANEAAAALRRKDDLKTLENELKLIPIAGSGTLYDWASAYVSRGEKLSALLSKRSDMDTKARKKATTLRSEAVGVLNDLRRAIAREMHRNQALPADTDAKVFSYFDTLEEKREAANRAAKAAKATKAKEKGTASAAQGDEGKAQALESPANAGGEQASG